MALITKLISGRAHRGLAAAVVLTLAAVSAVASPATAAIGPPTIADSYGTGWTWLRNWANQQKCMGVEGGDPKNGSRVVLWDCDGTANQRWYITGYGAIWNGADTGKCLGVSGGRRDQGAPLVTWDCDHSGNQIWRFSDSVGGCRSVLLVNNFSLFASVEGGSTQNNASIIQWPHASSPDQTWCITL